MLTHKHGHTQIVIGSCVSLTAGVVSGVDTSLTHLSLTWRSRQHFASVALIHTATHKHIQPLLLHAIKAARSVRLLWFPEVVLVSYQPVLSSDAFI